MSGFEIIGVVLGGLPLVVKVAKDYREGFEPFVKWRRFRLEFRTFINNVDLEKQLFDCLSDRLLEHADLSAEEKEGLLMGQNSNAWCQPHIKTALKERLGDSCPVCLHLLNAIGDDFLKLESMMSLKDGSIDWAEEGKDKWNYQRKRISHSFSRKGPATVASLGEKNRKFRDLLDALDIKAAARQSSQRKVVTKDKTWALIFECIRRQANSLHSALKSGWKCSCESPHLAALQLQKRSTGGWSSHFIMSFGATVDQPKQPKFRRRVIFTVEQNAALELSKPSRPMPTPVQEPYLNKLRMDFDPSSISQIDVRASNVPSDPRSMSAPVLTDVAAMPNIPKPARRIAFATTSEVITEKQSVWNTWRGQKARKDVRTIALHQKPQVPKDPCVKQVSVTGNAVKEENIPQMKTKIEDLCAILETSETDLPYLGYLSDDEHRHHRLQSLKDKTAPSEIKDLISLEKLLCRTTLPTLNRKQRFRLAVVLASSLLQLQTTPWLPDKLEKKEIFFEYHGREVMADQPYIYQSFTSTKLCPSTPSNNTAIQAPTGYATRTSLINLGILLLELCFGQAIETTPYLNEFLVDGKKHNQTDYLTAMEWVSEVEQEAGLDFQNAIKSCFDFDVKPNWKDMTFTQSIYSGVVQPLEKVVMELGWSDVP